MNVNMGLDIQQIFNTVRECLVVLAPDSPQFTILAVTDTYLLTTRTDRENILGKSFFEVFPGDPSTKAAGYMRASLQKVMEHHRADVMGIRKHGIRPTQSEKGGCEEQFWKTANYPVLNAAGQVSYIIHHIEDVTDLLRSKQKESTQQTENILLRDSRRAAINLMEDAVEARSQAEQVSENLLREIAARKRAEDLLTKQTTQLQERTAQLEESNKELESFSYSVSHDLKAPLRAIDGFSRKLAQEYGDKIGNEAGRLIDVIRSNTEKMGSLIDDLLSFSKVQKTDMNISEIDMDKLVNEVWNEIRAAHQKRELEFKATKILPGFGDSILIKQVLFNLFSNAVKFTKIRKPSIIEMSSYKDSDNVVYCTKDNGVGFDMAHYDKLFGVFQRLHGSDEYEGTGVGLAIVQRIISRHGGRVWAEGKVDKGATFYFTLPSTFTK